MILRLSKKYFVDIYLSFRKKLLEKKSVNRFVKLLVSQHRADNATKIGEGSCSQNIHYHIYHDCYFDREGDVEEELGGIQSHRSMSCDMSDLTYRGATRPIPVWFEHPERYPNVIDYDLEVFKRKPNNSWDEYDPF